MPDALPEYRIKARNTSADSENKIHDDTVARQHGFRGALVPGVTIYAYLTQPVAAVLGEPWLTRGTAAVRFLAPIFDGEEVLVTGAVIGRDSSGLTATLRASTTAGGECAVLEVTVPAGTPTPVNLTYYPAAPLPSERPPVDRTVLDRPGPLGTPEVIYDETQAGDWLERVTEPLDLYQGAGGWTHPAFFLNQSNRTLSRNVRLGPWIHVGSRVRHLGGARVGQTLRTRGRVRSLWEKKGREYVELDLVVTADARPAAHVLHTAIYRLPLGESP